MTDLESDKGRPLTAEENAKLRELLEKDSRILWFWGSLRVWAMWITAIAAAVYALQDVIRQAILAIVKG